MQKWIFERLRDTCLNYECVPDSDLFEYRGGRFVYEAAVG